jgi:hypothetical protein
MTTSEQHVEQMKQFLQLSDEQAFGLATAQAMFDVSQVLGGEPPDVTLTALAKFLLMVLIRDRGVRHPRAALREVAAAVEQGIGAFERIENKRS